MTGRVNTTTDDGPVTAWRRFSTALRTGDQGALRAAFAAEASYYDPISGSVEGADAITATLIALVAPLESIGVEVVSVVEQGNRAAIEWVQTGILRSRLMRVQGASFVTEVGGQIAVMRDCFYVPPSRPARSDQHH